jgi:hypothetical protein
MRPFRPSSPHRRLAALAATVLFAGSGLAQAAHEALVHHERCAHGEWVHASESPAPAGRDGQSIAGSVAKASGHAHHHCTASGRSLLEGSGTFGPAVAPAASFDAPVLRASPARAARTPLYALAPKASPPPVS